MVQAQDLKHHFIEGHAHSGPALGFPPLAVTLDHPVSPSSPLGSWVGETPLPTKLSSQGHSPGQPTSLGRRLLGSNQRGAFPATSVSLPCLVGVNEVDYCWYPAREIQLQWLRYYLEAQKGTAATPREVERLYAQVNKFALVSA